MCINTTVIQMLDKLKKIIRKNKGIYFILRIFYTPLKQLVLYKPICKYRDEAIYLLNRRDVKKPTIFFFGVPVHKNLGDWAQTICSFQYFQKFWPDYEVLGMRTYSTYSKKYICLLKEKIREEDIIFFQSGYCTTDQHLDHTMHKIIMRQFPNTKIIFMPQTVLFHNKIEREMTSAIFNKHKRTLFIARDQISYETAMKMFPDLKVECFPDIVTTLIGKYTPDRERSNILMCLRSDYEQLYSSKEIDILIKKLNSVISRIDVTDTSCNEINYNYLAEHIGEIIKDKIDLFSKYKLVITDRYHGTIFSLIANVPVVVLASNDHKVKTGVEWFKGIYDGMCYLADNIEEAEKLAMDVIAKESCNLNAPYFEMAYYSKLRKLVEEL